MPYKCEKINLKETQKRSAKLTTEQREEIAKKYKTGTYSQKGLALEYEVSRRLVQFIIDPKKHEENLKRRAERGGSKQYYDKEKHTKAMKKHRHYKQGLFLKGELE
jgi:acetyl-CoA carboxylase carboxyltransferase component